MTKVDIAYNPYKLTTSIYVNGKKPKQNSSLNPENRRLQEWVDKLPDILLNEYPDNNYDIQFTGTQVDYDDLASSFSANKDIKVNFKFAKKGDAETIEKAIDEIFQEIKEGPVAELRDNRIKEAFERAKNQQFEINVIATMSAGKSTLINALLGKKLMPIGNLATTATIVKILDKKGQKEFSAKAFDQNHKLVKQYTDITYQDMVSLNKNENVSTIEIQGDIPFVRSVGMKLVLIDTPGPNNSRDKQHEMMTYRMLENSDKSLVLFVINGRQVGIKDEQDVLGFVCKTMDKGGKQSRERYIFAANQMDAYDIDDEGIGCIEKALNDEKEILEGKGIINPNIFPVASRPALEARTKDPKRKTLDAFIDNASCSEVYHFEKYYHFSHLPQKARTDVESWLIRADEGGKIEIHTGIVSIEQAINQYVNKYARTTKVNDLVQSFNGTLKELATISKIEEAIRKDKSKKKKLEGQITQIQEKIDTAKAAMTISSKIDAIDLKEMVEKKVTEGINVIRTQITSIISSQINIIEKSIAIELCAGLEKKCNALPAQISAAISSILDETYKEALHSIIEEYKKYLYELNIGSDTSELSFNPINLVMGNLDNLSRIIDDNTETVDASFYKEEFVASKRKWYNPFTWFKEGDHYEKVKIEKYVDRVPMRKVATDYLQPIQKQLEDIKEQAINESGDNMEILKESLKKELEKIDELLNAKLTSIKKVKADTEITATEIKRKEENLKWLESIQERVDNLIEF